MKWFPDRAMRRSCAASALPFLGACSHGVLDPRGPVGAANRQMALDALAVMLAIALPTIAAALAFAWWFRASNPRAARRPQWAYSGALEIVVWSIPLLVILFLAGMIWIGSHRLDPARPLASEGAPLEVEVVSLDWKWLFIYPQQGVASVNELFVPVGAPVHFSVTSASVMNAFFVPQLGSMIAAMNGMVTQVHLQADQAGDYYGESAQFSGDGFSDMNFVVHAVPAGRFAEWVAAARRAGRTLDRDAYSALLEQGGAVPPSAYGVVDAGLFHAIVRREVPPGPGPRQGHGGADVNPRPAE